MPTGHHDNKRGPRKPTALKVLAGTIRKDRQNPAEPNVKPGWPAKPKLSRAEGHQWRRVGTLLAGMGVLTPADGDALEAYCRAYVGANECWEHIHRDGEVLTDRNGKSYRNPWCLQLSEYMRILTDLRGRFGLTPADRSRVSTVKGEAPKNKEQEWRELLG